MKVDRDQFFVVEESGKRHYGADIEKLRHSQKVRWAIAAVAVIVFAVTLEWHPILLGDDVLAYAAVYGAAGYSIWRIIRANALIHQFDQQWADYQRDQAHAAADAQSEKVTTQKPHGNSKDDGLI